MNRREFIIASATAAIPIACKTPAEGDDESLIVDTHVHCFAGINDARFPYHARAPYRPEEPATPQHLLECMDDAGIKYAVIVHPEPYQDDHRYLEYCLDIGQGRLKGTCLVFTDRAGSVEKIPDLVKRMPIVAVRIHAYAPDRLPPFGKPELRHLWKTAADHNLSVQLHFEPRYAPGFEPLIREFSTTIVIIDHLGRPFQGTPEDHEKVVRWSELKNTVMKISALPSPQTYPHRDVGPIVERLVQAYGPDRVLYGGGYGAEATGQSYRATVARARGYISFLPRSDQRKILGGNARRLFQFA